MNDDDIRDLGRKARERRAEGISKRSAIVRLLAEPETDPTDRKAISLLPASARQKKKPVRPRKTASLSNSKKRNRYSNQPASATSPRKKQQQSINTDTPGDADVDTRTPDIAHLLIYNNSNQGNDVSNTVRIHGLPLGTKRGDLIRFFAGLSPKHIFMLPPNNLPIKEWDAVGNSDGCDDDDDDDKTNTDSDSDSAGDEKEQKGEVQPVKRHKHSFRVYVRFESAPEASLAAQRSGEEIFIGKASDETKNSRRRRGATIAVSQVPKEIAKYLFEHMVRHK